MSDLTSFNVVHGDTRSEVARNLSEPVPQSLGVVDQIGLWGNLGVSLLGFTGAIFVLQPNGPHTPELSIVAAITHAHGGEVEVEPPAGRRSIVVVGVADTADEPGS